MTQRFLPISVAEKTGRNPSSACGRGAGVRAFIRRMNLTQAGQTGVFCPPPSLRDTSSRRREEGLVVRVFVLGYSQAGEMLGSWAVAKREKCWVPGLSPSGHISTVEKIAERIKRNPSPACGRGAGVRAFIRRMNLVKRNRQAFFALFRRFATPPPAGGRRDWLCEFLFWVTAKREKCWVPGLSPSGKSAGFSDCRQAGKLLGSRTAAKRGKCWVPGLPPSGRNAGFLGCRQAGKMLGSRTAAKRDRYWVLGLPPSGKSAGFLGCRQAGIGIYLFLP